MKRGSLFRRIVVACLLLGAAAANALDESQLAGDGQAVIDRLLTGTRTHAERRAHEMHDAAGYLADLGVPSTMTQAAQSTHRRISASGHDGVHDGAHDGARDGAHDESVPSGRR